MLLSAYFARWFRNLIAPFRRLLGLRPSPPWVFISYSRKDRTIMEQVRSHLGFLERQGLIRIWVDDTNLGWGSEWESGILTAIDQARIAVLLISPDYLASEFIYPKELPRLRDRHEQGLKILPLKVRHCDWRSLEWLSKIQHRPERPLDPMSSEDRDTALVEVTEEIRSILNQDEQAIREASPSLRFLVVSGVLGLTILAGGYAMLLPHIEEVPSPPIGASPRVAVLDLLGKSCGPDSAWLRTAFSDILTEALRMESGLQITERHMIAEAEKDRALLGQKEPSDFWRHLGADYVVLASCLQRDDSQGVEIHPLLVSSSGDSGRVLTPVRGLPTHVFDLATTAGRNIRQVLGTPDLSPDARLDLERALPRAEAMRSYFEGISHLRAGDVGSAREHFDAIPENERGPLAHWARARALWLLGEAQEATTALTSAWREAASLPDETRHEIAAMSHEWDNRWARAALEYGRLFELHPERYDLVISYARAQALAGNLKTALSKLESLLRDDQPLRARAAIAYAIADLAHDYNDNNSALKWATEAKNKADEADAVFVRAKAELLLAQVNSSLGSHELAKMFLSTACEDFRRLQAYSDLVACRGQQAVEGFHTGDTNLTDQIRGEYEATDGKLGLGDILILESAVATERGELAKALVRLDQAIEAYKGARVQWGSVAEAPIAGSFAERALVLFMVGHLADARASADQALAMAPGNTEIEALARGIRAEAAYHLGLLEEAEEEQRKVLDLDTKGARLADVAYDRFKLGTILALKGDPSARPLLEFGVYQQDKAFFRAEASIGLADLEISEGNTQKALQLASDAEEILRPGNRANMAMLARLAIVRALLTRESWQEARKALGREANALETAQDFRIVYERDIATAQLLARSGNPKNAVFMLQKLIARASHEGHRIYELEARIAMGEVLSHGDPEHAEQARLRLEETARAAAEMGASQMERKAHRSLR